MPGIERNLGGQKTIQLAGPQLKTQILGPGMGFLFPARTARGYNALIGVVQNIAGAGNVSLNVYQSPDPVAAGWTLVHTAVVAAGAHVQFAVDIRDEFVQFEVVETSFVGATVIVNANLIPVASDVAAGGGGAAVQVVDLERGGTITHFNGPSGAASTPMFVANANRLEFFGVNIGPRPIHISFGVPAVFGAGQYVAVGAPFTIDRESGLAINFIDDGAGAVRAVVSATEISTP